MVDFSLEFLLAQLFFLTAMLSLAQPSAAPCLLSQPPVLCCRPVHFSVTGILLISQRWARGESLSRKANLYEAEGNGSGQVSCVPVENARPFPQPPTHTQVTGRGEASTKLATVSGAHLPGPPGHAGSELSLHGWLLQLREILPSVWLSLYPCGG